MSGQVVYALRYNTGPTSQRSHKDWAMTNDDLFISLGTRRKKLNLKFIDYCYKRTLANIKILVKSDPILTNVWSVTGNLILKFSRYSASIKSKIVSIGPETSEQAWVHSLIPEASGCKFKIPSGSNN